MPGEARWKQFKKEKQEERGPAGNVGMGLNPSMAEEIAVSAAAKLALQQPECCVAVRYP